MTFVETSSISKKLESAPGLLDQNTVKLYLSKREDAEKSTYGRFFTYVSRPESGSIKSLIKTAAVSLVYFGVFALHLLGIGFLMRNRYIRAKQLMANPAQKTVIQNDKMSPEERLGQIRVGEALKRLCAPLPLPPKPVSEPEVPVEEPEVEEEPVIEEEPEVPVEEPEVEEEPEVPVEEPEVEEEPVIEEEPVVPLRRSSRLRAQPKIDGFYSDVKRRVRAEVQEAPAIRPEVEEVSVRRSSRLSKKPSGFYKV